MPVAEFLTHKAYGCVNSSNLCWQILATESSNGAPTSHVDDPTNKFLGRSGKDYIQSNGINVGSSTCDVGAPLLDSVARILF
jgi:hypothetical protein